MSDIRSNYHALADAIDLVHGIPLNPDAIQSFFVDSREEVIRLLEGKEITEELIDKVTIELLIKVALRIEKEEILAGKHGIPLIGGDLIVAKQSYLSNIGFSREFQNNKAFSVNQSIHF